MHISHTDFHFSNVKIKIERFKSSENNPVQQETKGMNKDGNR